MNPGAHAHVPAAVQSAEAAQDGEHMLDCISRRVKGPELIEGGSCDVSGTESQMMMGFVVFCEGWSAIQTLDEKARDLNASGVERFEGVDGREVREEFPA